VPSCPHNLKFRVMRPYFGEACYEYYATGCQPKAVNLIDYNS